MSIPTIGPRGGAGDSGAQPPRPPRGPAGASRPVAKPFTLFEAAKVWGFVIVMLAFGVPLTIVLWKWALA
jgi:hypothetical protein